MSVVLVVDDDASIRTVVSRALTRAGHQVETAANAAGLWKLLDSGAGEVLVTDVMLPDADVLELLPSIHAARPELPVVVISARNTLMTAVRATEAGAFDYLPKPFDLDRLTQTVAAALARAPLVTTPGPMIEPQPMIGRSAAMQEVYRLLARVVPTELPVLILGESGTGKELVARALHDLGSRASGPFVAINMAAIPRELIESELFGHERGAFTGAAAQREGRFAQAARGTLFLDEIGDMPMEAQTRLLRVLQSGEFSSVGSARATKTDVRVVSATHQDLARRVEAGVFRQDLFYRLNVVPIRLPPLRARAQDVPELATHFLCAAAADGLPSKRLDAGAIEALSAHSWPGNIRELENLMRRLAAVAREEVLSGATIRAALAETGVPAATIAAGEGGLAAAIDAWAQRLFGEYPGGLPPDGLIERALAEIEPRILAHALMATGGNQVRAARLLGLNRNTLRKKLNERGIDPHGSL
jgi:two-component system nitrogen regulation response regulator GlnG